jgi:two-component system cell cycle sensor histidine kinase/response regulator CckA
VNAPDSPLDLFLTRTSVVAGASVTVLGLLVLGGWLFDIPNLTGVLPGQATMKPNTAVCFVLLGAGLCLLAGEGRNARGAARVAATLVLMIAVATVIEYGTSWNLGIDELLFRDPKTPPELNPGRMAVATAVGFLLSASAFLLTERGARHGAVGSITLALSGAVVAIGALGLLGYAFEVVFLYTWYSFGSIAVPAAAGFILLGAGLLAAGRAGAQPSRPVSDEQRITWTAALALIVAASAMGIVGISALESQLRRSIESELRHLLDAHLAELTTNLELRATRAEIITTRPNMLRYLRILTAGPPRDQEARRVIQGVLESFLPHDFSMISVTLPGGEEVARAGETPSASTLEVPLAQGGNATLVWRGDMSLHHQLALRDADGALGSVVAEQRLPRITQLLLGNQTGFASAEFLLCSPAGPAFRCFPSRLSRGTVVVPYAERGPPRLAHRALTEGPGVSTSLDYRGHRVLGAFTQLPDSGLVAVLKVDVDEIYAPIRRQVGLATLLVAAVTVGGVALVWTRVGPLAARLETRVRDRTAELRESETALAKAAERLSLLHEIDRGVIAGEPPVAVAEAVLGRLRELLGVPRAIVNLFDFETDEAEWLAAAGRRRIRVGPGVRFPLALMGDIDGLRRGELQVVEATAQPHSEAVEALLASGVHEYMVVPMIAEGELIGGLSFGGAPGQFPPEQIAIAQEVAAQLAIAIAHMRLRDALRENEERTRLIVENALDVVVTINAAGRVTGWNPQAETTFGWPRGEILGRLLSDTIIPERYRAAHANGLARFLVTGEGPVLNRRIELSALHRDGHEFPIELSISPARVGSVVTFSAFIRDITERTRAETALRDSERRYRLLAENVQDVIALFDLDFQLVYISPSIERLRGYSVAETLSQTREQHATPASLELAARTFAEELTIEQSQPGDPSRSRTLELELLRKDGSTVWVETTLSFLRDDAGTAIGVIGVSRDITERRRAEAEKEQVEAQLRQAQKIEGIGQLAGGIAHDFNNLLTVITGRAQILLSSLGPDHPFRRNIEMIERTAARAAALTRQLLAFSRQQVLAPKIVALRAVVDDLTPMLQRLIGEDIELVVLGSRSGRVKADQAQLEQVITNLAVNARDAMPRGGQISIEVAEVDLDAAFAVQHPNASSGAHVMLAVSDSGTGMSAEIQARIFEPFFTTKEVGRGTGLGLSTVHGIVKQHRGSIEVESAVGRGTSIRVYLPRSEEPVAPAERREAGTWEARHHETLLLVEDEETVRDLAQEILTMTGYTVLAASEATDALRIAEHHRGPIHLLLTDMVMPRMNGRELAERVSAMRPETKVLYMSGYAPEAILGRGLTNLIGPLLPKPFTPDDLLNKVREILDGPGLMP